MKKLTLKNTKAQLFEGYERSLDEIDQLKKQLQAKDSELISFENYYQDFLNRCEIHSREWNLLFKEDLPRYWSTVKSNFQLLTSF
tara:strand:+ start:194 stop:448 length:255 start_codon:yes stop_codon:yes gene_type:complete